MALARLPATRLGVRSKSRPCWCPLPAALYLTVRGLATSERSFSSHHASRAVKWSHAERSRLDSADKSEPGSTYRDVNY